MPHDGTYNQLLDQGGTEKRVREERDGSNIDGIFLRDVIQAVKTESGSQVSLS